MDIILSIRYDKRTSEYRIRRRDTITGETSTTYANHLTEREKLFAKSANFFEDQYSAQWTP